MCRAHCRVVELPLSNGKSCLSGAHPRFGGGFGIDGAIGGRFLFSGLNEFGRSIFFRHLRLIKLLLRHVTAGCQRTKSLQRAHREIMIFFGTFRLVSRDRSIRTLSCHQLPLRLKLSFRDVQVGRGLFDRQPIGHRIDLEKEVGLGHVRVFGNGQLNDTAADGRGDTRLGVRRTRLRATSMKGIASATRRLFFSGILRR